MIPTIWFRDTALPPSHTLAWLIVAAIASFLATAYADNGKRGLDTARGFPINLEFSIGDVEFSPSVQFRDIRARCVMLVLSTNRASCSDATLLINDSPFGRISIAARLAWEPAKRRWIVDARGRLHDMSVIEIHLDRRDGETEVVVEVDGFDLALLPKIIDPLPPALAEYEFDSGIAALRAVCRIAMDAETTCQINGKLEKLNVNGVNVAEDVTMDFDLVYASKDSRMDLDFSMSLRHGALYIEPGFTLGGINPGFFIAATDPPIELAIRFALLGTSEIRILNADLTHPGLVEMHFAGDLTISPSLAWEQLDFTLHAPDVKEFYATYMQPIALETAFGSLETAGGVSVNVLGEHNVIDELDIRFDDIYLDDEAGRYSLYGLDGDLKLHAGDEIRQSHLSWIGGAIYRIEIGPGRIDWESNARNLKIASWQNVAIFDGEFRMDSLEILDFSTPQAKVALSGTLTPITLSALTSAFGWMPLSGKLSGTIPRLTYSDNRLEMDGALHVNIFDGDISIRELQINEMFSTVPVLYADVNLAHLDLQELTRTLSFGNITGRIDGKIAELELQAWRPIHFDASISTPLDDDSPHRISRQAVDNLGRLGAGTGSVLSQGWLSLIPSYSYGRLGLACRLVNGYCLMGGIEDAADGTFFVLTRGGILPPWIGIKGTGRRIKWKTLVDGIKQISQGNWELDIGS